MKDMNRKSNTFRVVEQFISINGEGRRAGQLALFIRFAGCNLSCEYCDTKWANEKAVSYQEYTVDELYRMIKESKVKNITLTGGEPLIQPNIDKLLETLRQDTELRIEIETNGSVDIQAFLSEKELLQDNVSFTLDYKTSVSGMEEKMHMQNYVNLRKQDTVKFVVGSTRDLEKAKDIIENYHLVAKGCGIYVSPCFGKIEPADMVDFLVEHRLNDVNVQLQLHKFIWDPDKRGV
jgi:7-carboxy-7-deazaguanine synthase